MNLAESAPKRRNVQPSRTGLPSVSIVGRPNVGKSTLFNAFAGRRISIVEATPGVTRDRITTEILHGGTRFELIDTGGIGIVDCDDLDKQIQVQINAGIERSDVILFVVDVKEGIVPLDREVAERLRKSGKKVLLAVNKIDHPHQESGMYEFAALGFGEPWPVSGIQGFGRTDLLNALVAALPQGDELGDVSDEVLRLAIVGRRNVGKSTFVNSLCQAERVIVSDVPGTTRDAVDVHVEIDGKPLVIVDTAGIQKAKQIKDNIEFYSQTRSEAAIRRCDVVALLLDASRDIGELERRIAGMICDAYKPCVIVVNKWDLCREQLKTSDFADYIAKTLPFLQSAPIVFTTALTGKHVYSVLATARSLFNQASKRAPTWKVNNAVAKARDKQRPRVKAFLPRIYYGTQISVRPPTFLLFVNKPQAFDKNYRRYLNNEFQELLDFPEVPLRFVFKERKSFFEEGGDNAVKAELDVMGDDYADEAPPE